MLPFPMPPLKFRTVGFPQYGFKPGPLNYDLPSVLTGLNAIPISPFYPKVCHSLRLSTPVPCSDPEQLCFCRYQQCPMSPSACLSHSVAIRPAFPVSSNHPSPEALRIEKSYVVSSHPRSYGLIRLSDKLLPTSLSRLYGRSLAFQDSSCLSIRLSPLYLHISHRLPPPIRREVYQVPAPIPFLIPLAITNP